MKKLEQLGISPASREKGAVGYLKVCKYLVHATAEQGVDNA